MADPATNPVAAYTRVADVDVIMTVIRPKAIVGLGNLLILNPVATMPSSSTGGSAAGGSGAGSSATPASNPDDLSAEDHLNGIISHKTDSTSGAVYVEYRNMDGVSQDYHPEDAVYKKANAYFLQDYHSDRVAVLTYQKDKQDDALKAFWYFNWTFAIQATSNNNKDDMVALSNIFEANKDHFLVLQTSDITLFNSLQSAYYTIGLEHNTDEAMDAALVGAIASRPVGSTTWKFKNLKGITPEVFTSTELQAIKHVNAIAYTEVFSKGETTEGTVLSGEYIDTLHGILWVKNHMQEALEKLLQDNAKIPYEQNGINMILATATQVLAKAWEQGIVLTTSDGKGDYSVTATGRDEQAASDLSDRHYGGLSFVYHASGAVHSITVQGSVQSDTIMQA